MALKSDFSGSGFAMAVTTGVRSRNRSNDFATAAQLQDQGERLAALHDFPCTYGLKTPKIKRNIRHILI